MTPDQLPGKWPVIPLLEAGKWLSGGTPSRDEPSYWDGTIPWIGSKDVRGFNLSSASEHVTQAGVENGSRVVGPGALLMVLRGMSLDKEFRVGVTTREVAFNQDVKALVPRADLDGRFLAWYLRAAEQAVLAMVDTASHGTKRLPTERLERLSVPVPSPAEQRRIADILDKADGVRRMRADAAFLHEKLLRGAFDDWFGDPVANPRGLPVVRLGDLCAGPDIVDGPFGSSLKPECYTSSGVPVVRNQNILVDDFECEFVYVSPTKYEEVERSNVQSRDLVVTSKGTIGRVALAPDFGGPAVLSASGTVRIRLPEGGPLLPEFAVRQMSHPSYRRYMESFSAGSNQQYLSLSMIRNFLLIVPPVGLQERMALLRAHLQEVVSRSGSHARHLDTLFHSLLHRAFTGAL